MYNKISVDKGAGRRVGVFHLRSVAVPVRGDAHFCATKAYGAAIGEAAHETFDGKIDNQDDGCE